MAKEIIKESKKNIQVIKNGELASTKGADSYFTRSARVDSMLPTTHELNILDLQKRNEELNIKNKELRTLYETTETI